jgi:hypothetical protein
MDRKNGVLMRKDLFIISTIVAKTAIGQPPESSAWLGLQLPVSFNAKWTWHNDAGYRTLGFNYSAYQYLYRTGARYHFNKDWNTAGGLALFFTRSTLEKVDDIVPEFRGWQELAWNKGIGAKFSIQNRLRVEERWFAATKNIAAYYASRYRYRVSVTRMLTGKWSLQLADEYMRQSVKGKLGFNQNRVAVSTIYAISATTQLQGGYMWTLWPAASQHNLTMTFHKSMLWKQQ